MTILSVSKVRSTLQNWLWATKRATMSASRTASCSSTQCTRGAWASSFGGLGTWLDDENLACVRRQVCGDGHGRALPQIVDIRLVGHAEKRDPRVAEAVRRALDALADMGLLG